MTMPLSPSGLQLSVHFPFKHSSKAIPFCGLLLPRTPLSYSTLMRLGIDDRFVICFSISIFYTEQSYTKCCSASNHTLDEVRMIFIYSTNGLPDTCMFVSCLRNALRDIRISTSSTSAMIYLHDTRAPTHCATPGHWPHRYQRVLQTLGTVIPPTLHLLLAV